MTLRTEDGTSRIEHGFTLIEVMVVLAVLGLALGLVVARGPMRSVATEVGSAGGMVAQGMRLARAQAIAQGHPVSFAIDPTHRAIRVGDNPAQALPAAVSLAVHDAAGGVLPPTRIATIGFAPDGSSTGGTVDLADGGRRVHVAVDWLTGRVRVDAGR